MQKLKVIKYELGVKINIFGEVFKEEYRYMIAVRRWYFWWSSIKFDYYCGDTIGSDVENILNDNTVIVSYHNDKNRSN